MAENLKQSPKFAFYYLLSLVALVFTAVSVGIICFEIINKNIKDVIDVSMGVYDSGSLKFAISSLFIAAPVYFLLMWLINRSLVKQELDKDSQIKRWLSYLILFVASVVMIVRLIMTMNTFLDGDLTFKFILKTLSLLAIAGAIFGYYLYDLKREEYGPSGSLVNKIYFGASVLVIVVGIVFAFLNVESPRETRARRMDEAVLNKFYQIDSALQDYYTRNDKLPKDMNELLKETRLITADDIKDPATQAQFDYKLVNQKEYELCATFQRANTDTETRKYYPNPQWLHEAGYQCIRQKVLKDPSFLKEAEPIMVK